MPESAYGAASLERPLLSTRWDSVACEELGAWQDGGRAGVEASGGGGAAWPTLCCHL